MISHRLESGLLCCVLTLIISGCGGSLPLEEGEYIPSPVLEPAPLDMGLFLDSMFQNYTYSEKGGGSSWTIELGSVQTELFSDLIGAMFRTVVSIDDISSAGAVDAIIRPDIEDYAFSLPRDNGTDFYEVSVRYRVAIYQTDGTLLDSWAVTGYGRAASSMIPNAKDAVHKATISALRDVAAILAVGLPVRPTIKGLLQQKGAG